MSSVTYNKLLIKTKTHLVETVEADILLQNEEPYEDKTKFYNDISELYFKYIFVITNLDLCYDQTIQPQKRILVKKMLDYCLARVVELKIDLVNIDISDYNYNDEILVKLGMSPIEAEIKIPKYYQRERLEEIAQRRKFIEHTLHNLGFEEEPEEKKPPTELEAIKIIQIHERARQGRLRGQFMKEIKLLKEQGRPDGTKGNEELSANSALIIQRIWRGYITRRKIKKRKMDEMMLIGMTPPAIVQNETAKRAEKIQEYRYAVQKEHEKKYLDVKNKIEGIIKERRAGIIMDEITDEIRHWFKEYYDNSGKFPEFPSEEDGGSKIMFGTPGTESEVSKSTVISSKESKRSKEKEKESKARSSDGKGKGKEIKEIEFVGYKCTQSNFLHDISIACEEYEEVWRGNDESSNPFDIHQEDMIYKDKYTKIEAETRLEADETMRGELEQLQNAFDKDKGHKGKKSKKARKKKGRKGGKKGKKKKEKDLTPDRTTESLFEELVSNGIIKKYPEVSIESFIGEKSYAAYDLRNADKSTTPCLGDIRQIVKEYCIIPMGSDFVRQTTPLIRSVLITGPHGSGKKMIVNAICTELGAVLFDLTPANIVGKYPGKTGLIMLIHLINKVSRLLQPSVIFMDGAEKPFMKKVPKTDKTDPKRLKKDLPKIIKGITIEDKVIFIGTTHCPWEAEQKLLQQTFQKFIQIPRPDYGTLSYLWKYQLNQYSGISPHFDVSSIAKLSDGFTVGEILKVIKSVITTKRMLQLRVHRLTHAELIVALSKHEPVYREEDEAASQWWWKTPLGKKKQKAIELEEEMRKRSGDQSY